MDASAPRQPWQNAKASLPTFTQKEVSRHTTLDRGVWVTFGDAVYDITKFIQNHPGGVDKISMAAGGSVEPFWLLYRQHLAATSGSKGITPKEVVAEILAEHQVGWLDPADVEAAEAAAALRSPDDPYANEPTRHPALRMLSVTPCSGESPPALMVSALGQARLNTTPC